ncbi:hypothetical protein BJV82DRAFT_521352 [Fennellomyces sp. T-0311]|nr:hypothetical protein BJV82DRAFT_521352 [Fennellomyces sp. T-0311]
MSHSPAWIRGWFLISSIIVLWDAGYCLLRPHSMEGGKYNFLWRPYNLYAKIDTLYGIEAIESNNGFTGAQGKSFMNLVENALNFSYLYYVSSNPQKPGRASLIGFTAAIMTVAKTVLYWLVDFFAGMAHTGHNNLQDYILLWIIPNGAWILVPGLIAYTLGGDLVGRLDVADKKEKAN